MNQSENYESIRKSLEGKELVVHAFDHSYTTLFTVCKYSENGRAAIELIMKDDGEPFTTLTCNLNHAPLEDREVLIKTWSENEETAKCALESGLFRDTGKRISTGFVLAQIWEVL